MIGKVALLILKNALPVSKVGAAVWLGKKAYDYFMTRHAVALSPEEAQEKFPARECYPLATYNFNLNKPQIQKVSFLKTFDDLDTLYVSHFVIDEVLVMVQRYQNNPANHYTVHLDFESYHKRFGAAADGVEPLLSAFERSMGWTVQRQWSQPDMAKIFTHWIGYRARKNAQVKAPPTFEEMYPDPDDGDAVDAYFANYYKPAPKAPAKAAQPPVAKAPQEADAFDAPTARPQPVQPTRPVPAAKKAPAKKVPAKKSPTASVKTIKAPAKKVSSQTAGKA